MERYSLEVEKEASSMVPDAFANGLALFSGLNGLCYATFAKDTIAGLIRDGIEFMALAHVIMRIAADTTSSLNNTRMLDDQSSSARRRG